MKKSFYFLPILLLPAFFFLAGCQTKKPASNIADFVECFKMGYEITNSQPRQCRAPGGQIFTEEKASEDQDKIKPPVIANINPINEFCGWSTKEPCEASSDCLIGGCSRQVCYNKNNESIITTCEAKDCYNANQYQMKCQCLNRQCQWTK
ncbi:MAG: eight-cysteine-cluster domain-containing protein [bacterium]